MTKPLHLLLGALLLALPLSLALNPGQTARAQPLPALVTDAALAKKLASVLSDSRVTRGTVGVVVAESSSGAELYGRSATTAISPASNMKLVTAAAALDLLGPGHTFSTDAYAPAAPVNEGDDGDNP